MEAILANPQLSVNVVLRINNNRSIIPSISFNLPYDSKVNIVLLDRNRNELKVVVGNRFYAAGAYTEIINIKEFPAGEYYYKLETEKDIIIKRLSVMQ
jgi:hypothetical protein